MPETNLAEAMDASLEEELKSIKERDAEGAKDEPEEPVEPPEDKPEAKAEDEPEDPAPKKDKEPETPAEAPAEDPEPEAPEEESPAADESLKRPPTTFRAQAKADWEKVPESVKADIHKREKDAMEGLRQYREKAEFGDRLNTAIQPYQAFLNSKGIQPEKAVEDALNLGYSLSTASPQQKGMILKQIAQQYGADLSVLTQEDDAKPNPLEQEVQQLRQMFETQQRQGQEQTLQTAQRQIEQFASAVDDQGKLKYPYFDNVQPRMVALLQSGAASTLEEAYESAIWADPDTRTVLMSEQAKREAAKRQEEAKKRAAKAEKANAVNLDKKGKHESEQQPTGTIDDTLKNELQRLRSEGKA